MSARGIVLFVVAATAWLHAGAQTPLVVPQPVVRMVTNTPVFFECRNDELFRIDVEGLKKIFRDSTAGFDRSPASIAALAQRKPGDETYAIELSSFMVGVLMLKAKPGVHGETAGHLEKPDGHFRAALSHLDTNTNPLMFFVRPDGSNVWNQARTIATNAGFRVGSVPLAAEHPLTFEGAMAGAR